VVAKQMTTHATTMLATIAMLVSATACSSTTQPPNDPDTALIAEPAPTTAVTAPPPSTTQPPPTTQPSSTTQQPPTVTSNENEPETPGECDPCVEVVDFTRVSDNEVRFMVLDYSNRNVAQRPNATHESSTLNPRPIFVVAFVPPTPGPHPVMITGDYRNGPIPVSAENVNSMQPDYIDVHVSFAKMGLQKADFADIGNHPGDITTVLDVIEQDPTLVGSVDTSHVQYRGFSMGAISGYLFANTCCLDPRIGSAVLMSGFALDTLVGFQSPYDFSAGPQILAINNSSDTVIPYSLFRRLEPALASGNLTALTIITTPSGNGHAVLDGSCPPIGDYRTAWADATRRGEPAPPVPSSPCISGGFIDGGTEGYGNAGSFVVGS
jgi:hypothetical protein